VVVVVRRGLAKNQAIDVDEEDEEGDQDEDKEEEEEEERPSVRRKPSPSVTRGRFEENGDEQDDVEVDEEEGEEDDEVGELRWSPDHGLVSSAARRHTTRAGSMRSTMVADAALLTHAQILKAREMRASAAAGAAGAAPAQNSNRPPSARLSTGSMESGAGSTDNSAIKKLKARAQAQKEDKTNSSSSASSSSESSTSSSSSSSHNRSGADRTFPAKLSRDASAVISPLPQKRLRSNSTDSCPNEAPHGSLQSKRRLTKWTTEEVDALIAGVLRYGKGNWQEMQADRDLKEVLAHRSNVDLKDKARLLLKSGQLR
jgi:hypothetical protein